MTTSFDFDRLVTGWLEEAGPATMRPDAMDSALKVARETPRRTGIRAFLAGPSPWPRGQAACSMLCRLWSAWRSLQRFSPGC